MNADETVSRQRLAQIRRCILRDIIGWTLREPHRTVWFRETYEVFDYLVYPSKQNMRAGKKLCIGCQRLGRECWHPFTNFYKNHKMKEELDTYCKRCTSERSMQYAKDHKDQVNEYHRTYRERNIEASRAYWRKYYHGNREKRLDDMKRYQQKKKSEETI